MKSVVFCKRSVLAWQENGKTQTRRPVKPQPEEDDWVLSVGFNGRWGWMVSLGHKKGFECHPVRQPYAVGDICWIREALVSAERYDPTSSTYADMVAYCADGEYAEFDGWPRYWYWEHDKLPSIFMPRWACRHYAKVVSVRAERLQDISFDDAVAEGMPAFTHMGGVLLATPTNHRRWYMEWWADLHRKLGMRWKDNPWVWAYGLEKADVSTE